MRAENITIVALGDSITEAAAGLETAQRWPVLLEKKLNGINAYQRYRVINAGVGGNTSREGLARMDNDVLAHRPDIVLVEFGGNDAAAEGEREVGLEEYWLNLDAILTKINMIEARMVLLTFTPIVDDWHDSKKFISAGGLDGNVELYRDAVRRFAGERGLMLIDTDSVLREACTKFSSEEIILKDGIHLTAKANEIVAETIYGYLKGMQQ